MNHPVPLYKKIMLLLLFQPAKPCKPSVQYIQAPSSSQSHALAATGSAAWQMFASKATVDWGRVAYFIWEGRKEGSHIHESKKTLASQATFVLVSKDREGE